MLNPFPDLLVFGILAPALIRVSVGAVFFYLAVQHFRGRRDTAQALKPLVGGFASVAGIVLTLLELVVGLMLVVGAWTQIAAIIGIVLCLKFLMIRSRLTSLTPLSRSTYLLLLVMSLSLLVSGAGAFAFDLPL